MANKIASFDDILASKGGTRYVEEKAHGLTFRLGSVSSRDMLQWIEENDNKDLQKTAGLRLLVKSIVDPDGNRIPEARHDEFIESFRDKDAKENGRLVNAALILNGLRVKKEDDKKDSLGQALKNDSSEAVTGASPSDSPSQ